MKLYHLVVLCILGLLIFSISCDPMDNNDPSGDLPVCDFQCPGNFIYVDDLVYLEDISSGNPSSREWSIDPAHFSFEEGTNKHSAKPVVKFDFSGPYTITLNVQNEFGSDELTEEECIYVKKYKISWRKLPDMPHARGWFDPCVVGNKIYLLGGTFDQETVTDVFDPITETWSTEDIPGCLNPRFGCRAVAYDENILIMGGVIENGGNNQVLSNIEIFDPATQICAYYDHNIPKANVVFARALWEDQLYIAGGSVTLPFTTSGHLLDLRKFDFNTGIWTKLPDLPNLQTFAGGEIYEGKFYLAGGEVSGTAHSGYRTINVYDISSEKWEDVSEDFILITNTLGPGTCICQDHIFVIGGQSLIAATSNVQVIDPEGRTVEKSNNLPYVTVGPGVCSYGDKIYVFGGSPPAPFSIFKTEAYVGELTIAESYK